MAVDVLQFNEIKRQTNDYKVNSGYEGCRQVAAATTTCVNQLRTGRPGAALNLRDGFTCSYAATSNYGAQACFQCVGVTCLTTVTGSLRVCDTGANFNCGACCQWTVPAGASIARFQMWGAGAPAAGAVCCGFSVHGGTGAYASVIIPVVPGAQYTLCAGCAWVETPGSNIIQPCTDIRPYHGCASFVTGPRLSNVCAEGGEANPYNMIQAAISCNSCYTGYCIMASYVNFCDQIVGSIYGTHACMCSNPPFLCWPGGQSNYFCWHVNAYSGVKYSAVSCRTFYGSTTTGTPVYGQPGHLPQVNWNPDKCLCIWMGSSIIGSQCIYATLGCAACTPGGGVGCLQCGYCANFPGAPSSAVAAPGWSGMGSIVYSGGIACGQAGKMGMVCVQWA